jgi:hypothetical protein
LAAIVAAFALYVQQRQRNANAGQWGI